MSSALAEAVGKVLALTAAEQPEGNEVMAACMAVTRAAGRARPEEVREALSRLLIGVQHAHPQVAGIVAITGGALVENGAPADVLGPALLDRMPEVLNAAAAFVTEVAEALPEDAPPAGPNAVASMDGEDVQGNPRVVIAGRVLPSEVVGRAWARDANAVISYLGLEQWCFPAIACLTRDRGVRDAARARPELREAARTLAAVHHPAECLYKALAVLDDEPLLILHPDERQGYRCRLSGVADNFQLHILLADTLIAAGSSAADKPNGLWARLTGRGSTDATATSISPGRLSGHRPPPGVAAVWRGEGQQQSRATSEGVWNLYAWTAVRPDVTLPGKEMGGGGEPTDFSRHWVWNEGIPEDIPTFDGLRVVLLGPPSYVRTFNTARFFEALSPTLIVESALSSAEVSIWMRRFATAPRPAGA